MRRSIRSHVANRRMFQGGGLSPLEQPRGILASSQSLVDQVAQNAINPNPTMTMNQGGIARFQQGGGFGATSDIPRRISLGTNEELLRRLVPSTEGAFGSAGQHYRYYPPGITYPTARSKYQWSGEDISSPDYPDKNFVKLHAEDRSGHSRLRKGLGQLKDFFTQSYNIPIRAPYLGVKQWLMSGKSTENETGFNVADDFPTTTPPQLATIQAIIDMNEGREVEILTAAKKVITEGGSEETGIGLKEQINDVLNMTPPPPADVPMIGLLSEEIASQPAYGRLKEDVDVLEQEGDGKLRGYSNPDMPSPKRKTDVIDYGSLEGADVTNLGSIDVTGKQDDDKQDEDNPLAKFIDQQEVEVEGEGEGEDQQGEDQQGEDQSLVDQVIDAATTNDTEKTTKTIEDYKKEFIEAMPEYEGMSKDEKAYSWIKMGMAIAAGQSPNAIENISKGVLATIDEFADDPKKKREYEMQVALSAGKYAVESVNALRTQERALESQFENYVVKEDGTITFPDGTEKKVTGGQVVPISTADKIAGMNFDNLITTGMFGDQLAATKALTKLQNDLNKTLRAELVVDDDMTMKVTKEYNEALDKVIMGNELTSFIDTAMEMNAKGQVTGIKNQAKNAILKAFNAAGVSTEVIGMSEEEAVEALGGPQAYNDLMQVVANNMLKTLLGEGSKNISNVDRELAQEISGLVKTLQAGAFQNPALLNAKLQRIRSRIATNISQGEATINQLNTTFAHRLVPGTDEKFTEFVLQPLAKKATASKGTPYRDLGTDVGVLGEFITNDDGTFTYKMFEATS